MLKTMTGVTAATVLFVRCFLIVVLFLRFSRSRGTLLCSALASSDAQSGSRADENPSPPSVLLKVLTDGQICGTTNFA